MSYYSYIFVEKDMIPEQVAIQAAHVAMKMGSILSDPYRKSADGKEREWSVHYKDLHAENLSYVVTPAFTDWEELEEILSNLGVAYETFKDHNYTFEGGNLVESAEIYTKALMTYPIEEQNRGILKGLPLWRAKK